MKNYIDIATSNKALKNKIKQDVVGPTDKVYWYIRFNIPLEAESVNDDTMCVMDVKGNPLATLITYNSDTNIIVINPLMPYRPNEPYILTVFNEVRSSKGSQLKEDIQVVFKLKGTEISDYTVLKGKQLMNVEALQEHRRNVEKRKRIGMSAERITGSDFLVPAPASVNFIIGVIGIIFLAVSIYLELLIGLLASILLLLAGFVHIYLQLTNKKAKSLRVYNAGVKLYNSGNFESAKYRFENALITDCDNDFARYALTRVHSHIK